MCIRDSCATYVIGKRYGAEVSGFQFGKVAEMQADGQKDPQELRGFLNDVRQACHRRNRLRFRAGKRHRGHQRSHLYGEFLFRPRN